MTPSSQNDVGADTHRTSGVRRYVGIFGDTYAMVGYPTVMCWKCSQQTPPFLSFLVAPQQQLLGANADPNRERSSARLFWSIAKGKVSSYRPVAIVRSLLQTGADSQAFFHRGVLLLLHKACCAAGDAGVVHTLFTAETPVDALTPGLPVPYPLRRCTLLCVPETQRRCGRCSQRRACLFNKKKVDVSW